MDNELEIINSLTEHIQPKEEETFRKKNIPFNSLKVVSSEIRRFSTSQKKTQKLKHFELLLKKYNMFTVLFE